MYGLDEIVTHLRFKQAHPKMCHSPEVDNGVENQIVTSWPFFISYILNGWIFILILKVRAWPKYQLSADIHSQKAGTKFAHE